LAIGIGIGIGEILKEVTSVMGRRVGRVIKLGTPITVGVFLILETVHADYFTQPHVMDCRDDTVRTRIDQLLDWVGVPIMMGTNKFHVVTYADILRDLEPLNGSRAAKDRVTYDSLWVHATRHYDLEGLLNHWGDRVGKEFTEILGIPAWGSTESAANPGTNQVRRNGESITTAPLSTRSSSPVEIRPRTTDSGH
jgi:hypothetical protein